MVGTALKWMLLLQDRDLGGRSSVMLSGLFVIFATDFTDNFVTLMSISAFGQTLLATFLETLSLRKIS